VSENIYAPLVVEKTLFIILKLSVQILEMAPIERKLQQSYRDTDSRICLDMPDDILVPKWRSGGILN